MEGNGSATEIEREIVLGDKARRTELPKQTYGGQEQTNEKANQKAHIEASNQGPYRKRFEDNAVVLDDRRSIGFGEEIITVPTSPYVSSPESLHMMVVALGKKDDGTEKPLETFSELSPQQGARHFEILGTLAQEYQHRYGKRWYIGTNISPHEKDRQAVQTVKTIHTHVVGIDETEEFVPLSASADPKDIRQKEHVLADPFTTMATAVLREAVFTPQFRMENPDVADVVEAWDVELQQQYPKGYIIALKGGIDALKNPKLFELTRRIDEAIEGIYNEIHELIVETPNEDAYRRDILKPHHQRSTAIEAFAKKHELSEQTRHQLARAVRLIKSAAEVIKQAPPEEKTLTANTRLIIKGEAYTHLIFPKQDGSGELVMAIVPRIVSGGGPHDAMGIFKDQKPATQETIAPIIASQFEAASGMVREVFPEEILTERVREKAA